MCLLEWSFLAAPMSMSLSDRRGTFRECNLRKYFCQSTCMRLLSRSPGRHCCLLHEHFYCCLLGSKARRSRSYHDPTINMHTVTRVLPCSQQLSSVHDFELNHEHIAHMHCLTTFPSRSTIEAHHLPMFAILYLPQSEPLHMSTLL